MPVELESRRLPVTKVQQFLSIPLADLPVVGAGQPILIGRGVQARLQETTGRSAGSRNGRIA